MSPIESIIYMIWRGIAIGVLISAPMGPVGILCIQRTLDKGKKAGFYTGIGAAISDIFYCLLTGFGLSFIEDFINDNQNVIQLVGSIVLIAFSIYLFRKNPSSGMRRPLPQNVSAKKNILGGFLFTFSNPLIIFLIIGLFARFNFLIPEIKGYYYAIGYVFIAAGALLWWYGITYVINKVRKKFNLKAMKIMNISIGIVILGFAFVGIVSSIMGLISPEAKAAFIKPSATESESLHLFTNNSDTIMLVPLHEGTGTLDFKMANRSSLSQREYRYHGPDRKNYTSTLPPWSLIFIGDNDTLTLTHRIIEHSSSAIDSAPAAEFSLYAAGVYSSNICSQPSSVLITNGLDFGNNWNHFRLINDTDAISFYAGNRKLQHILTNNTLTPSESPLRVFLGIYPGSAIQLRDYAIHKNPAPSDNYSTLPLSEIKKRLNTTSDPLECEWQVLDINLNSKYLSEGGDYRVAIIKAPDSAYEIVYLEGARVNASAWQPGMLKGRLTPSGIESVYNLIWIDPFGSPMYHHLKARFTPPSTLLLQFPYHESTITLTPR